MEILIESPATTVLYVCLANGEYGVSADWINAVDPSTMERIGADTE